MSKCHREWHDPYEGDYCPQCLVRDSGPWLEENPFLKPASMYLRKERDVGEVNRQTIHDKCVKAYEELPTQDNEGFQPDKLGFFTGYKIAAYEYAEKLKAAEAARKDLADDFLEIQAERDDYLKAIELSNEFRKQTKKVHDQLRERVRELDAEVKTLREFGGAVFDGLHKKELAALHSQLADFREALEFYADKNNWLRSIIGDDDMVLPSKWADKLKVEDCAMLNCGGGRARLVLAKYAKGESGHPAGTTFLAPDGTPQLPSNAKGEK